MPWSPRNCGLLAFWVWQILAALCIAKHRVYVAWYEALTEPNAMLGVRYHTVSTEEGMVSNCTIFPVPLGFTAIFGAFLSMVFSERNPRTPC
jgi:hypothetical protein